MPDDPPPEGSARAAAVALGIPISLDNEVSREKLSVLERVALRDADLRDRVADSVVPVFLKANGWTLVGLAVLVALDELNLALHLIGSGDRIVGGKVIMALLGATTVQVGVIAGLIVRNLFPQRGG